MYVVEDLVQVIKKNVRFCKLARVWVLFLKPEAII